MKRYECGNQARDWPILMVKSLEWSVAPLAQESHFMSYCALWHPHNSSKSK